ncbi:MAG: response regulator [Desulfatibacillaceae bacterium]
MENCRVVLVDDEAEFVETVAERLALRGFDVRHFTDGHQAMEAIEEDPPDVAVFDLMMPGLGGLDLLEQVVKKRLPVQVILLTGRGSTREGIEGMRMGAYDYLMKPLQIEELVEKLEAAAGAEAGEGK